MKIEVGKEMEFVRNRLRDIKYLTDNTQPVDGDWSGYAKSFRDLIRRQVDDALKVLDLSQDCRSELRD